MRACMARLDVSVGVCGDEKLVVVGDGGRAERLVVGRHGQEAAETAAVMRVHRPAEHLAGRQARQQDGGAVVDCATAQVDE